MHKINVKGIRVYAFHGCLKEEAKIGGNYVVNVSITTDFSQAGKDDDLTKTIDYCQVNKIVEIEMAIRSKLIEHVGQRIVNALKTNISGIKQIEVEVIKISPPINGNVDQVSVTILE